MAQKKITNLELTERRELVDINDTDYSVREQCFIVGLNRSSWYYEPVPLSELDQTMMKLLDVQYIGNLGDVSLRDTPHKLCVPF